MRNLFSDCLAFSPVTLALTLGVAGTLAGMSSHTSAIQAVPSPRASIQDDRTLAATSLPHMGVSSTDRRQAAA